MQTLDALAAQADAPGSPTGEGDGGEDQSPQLSDEANLSRPLGPTATDSDPNGTWGTDLINNAELTCNPGYYRKGYADQATCVR